MKVAVLNEAGYHEAMLGLSLSFQQPIKKMPIVAKRLAARGEPHCKFLRQMVVWMDIEAPWYWWKHMATYRIGVETQSSSTMHKLLAKPLAQGDFESPIFDVLLTEINALIAAGDLRGASNILPGGFLYRRIVMASYSALRNIFWQRYDHRLDHEWRLFIKSIRDQIIYPDLLGYPDQVIIDDGSPTIGRAKHVS